MKIYKTFQKISLSKDIAISNHVISGLTKQNTFQDF